MAMDTGRATEKAFFRYIMQAQVTAQVIGGDATGGKRSFVPIDDLRQEFFLEDTIRSLLYYYGIDVQIAWERVHEYFLAVFSILITIGKASYLPQFTRQQSVNDSKLPFTSKDGWHSDCHSFFDEFYKAQWQFCAQPFTRDWLNGIGSDDPNTILPIIHERCLKHGPDAYTYWIKVHPSYDQIDGHPATNEYLLKTCKREHAKLHRNEVGAYRTLSEYPTFQPYLPRFYGSWKMEDTYYMLLEYIEGGTLTHFLETHNPPEGPEEMMRFWSALLRIAIPVMGIHSLALSEEPHLNLHGIHHDIKTDNILVKFDDSTSLIPESQHGSNIVLKLADLGLAELTKISNTRNKAMRDKPGTQTYSSPENFVDENNETHCRIARKAEPSKDIWALGCVFSQGLVWSVLGPKGLADYQAARVTEISTIRKLQRSAYSECFHDGFQVLKAVNTYQTKAYKSKRDFDEFVLRVHGLVQMMLSPVKHRFTAEQVWMHALRILEDVENTSRDALYPGFWRTGSPCSDSQTTMSDWCPDIDLKGLGVAGVKTGVDLHLSVTSDASSKHAPNIKSSPSRPYRIPPPELPSGHPTTTAGPSSHNRKSNSRTSINSIAQSLALAPNIRTEHPGEGPNCATIHEEGTAMTMQHGRQPSNEARSTCNISPGAVSQSFPEATLEPKPNKRQALSSVPVATAGLTGRGLPSMTIDEVTNWIGKTKDKSTVFPHKGDRWLSKLRGRDQIFLIDDSETMQPHWNEVVRAFQALAYLVKRSDYDGIELRFANNIAVGRCAKHRKPLTAILNRIHPGGKCDIGLTFERIIDSIELDNNSQEKKWTISRRFKKNVKWGTSIYVLTNGMWEEQSDWLSGIVDPLKKLMLRKAQRRQVGVQFIQFGNDPAGTAHLKELDDELAKYGVERDMVDTTHVSGNVFKMLLGSFDPVWDHCESPRTPSSSASMYDSLKAQEFT